MKKSKIENSKCNAAQKLGVVFSNKTAMFIPNEVLPSGAPGPPNCCQICQKRLVQLLNRNKHKFGKWKSYTPERLGWIRINKPSQFFLSHIISSDVPTHSIFAKIVNYSFKFIALGGVTFSQDLAKAWKHIFATSFTSE